MATSKEVRHAGYYMGRLSKDCDLLEALERFCIEKGITLGRVEALGALQKARLGYYDQKKRIYRYVELDRNLEVTSLMGNISLRDGRPMVHAHMTLADREGKAFGGHLTTGNVVFACEFVIQAFEGAVMERTFDPETDLFLWDLR
ncbi:PPC domain-containing DNA-binding protein [Desulfatiglans anilini]|uniref:PPC domain-containing DNA-binding protein n=1 Tax=Desulfatiglans anilini TaxID=90728 RepID=UPI0004152DA2|nr:PPC domain-containing DNA-binding protein [Desulfatiglans anilini]